VIFCLKKPNLAWLLVASPMWQLGGVVVSVVLSILMGVIVGFIVSKFGRKETPYDDKDEFILAE